MLDKQGYTRAGMHTYTRPGTDTHAHVDASERTRKHKCTTSCFSTATMICNGASLFRNTHIVCPVNFFRVRVGWKRSEFNQWLLVNSRCKSKHECTTRRYHVRKILDLRHGHAYKQSRNRLKLQFYTSTFWKSLWNKSNNAIVSIFEKKIFRVLAFRDHPF